MMCIVIWCAFISRSKLMKMHACAHECCALLMMKITRRAACNLIKLLDNWWICARFSYCTYSEYISTVFSWLIRYFRALLRLHLHTQRRYYSSKGGTKCSSSLGVNVLREAECECDEKYENGQQRRSVTDWVWKVWNKRGERDGVENRVKMGRQTDGVMKRTMRAALV